MTSRSKEIRRQCWRRKRSTPKELDDVQAVTHTQDSMFERVQKTLFARQAQFTDGGRYRGHTKSRPHDPENPRVQHIDRILDVSPRCFDARFPRPGEFREARARRQCRVLTRMSMSLSPCETGSRTRVRASRTWLADSLRETADSSHENTMNSRHAERYVARKENLGWPRSRHEVD